MEPFDALSILITLAAGFAYVNHRFLGMTMSIALMAMSLVISIGVILAGELGFPAYLHAERIVRDLDFSEILLRGMLGLLLFAGALHIHLDDLADKKLEISIYSTLGVLTSTVLVGTTIYGLSNWLGWELRLVESFLFGALISPTDPIAVLGILKKSGAPKSLETKISGESLFNDGIGVVVFLILLEIATGLGELSVEHVILLFAQEAAGGLLFGLVAGYGAYRMLKSVNNYQVEIMVTLALVIGGYALADALHISGPLAMVAAGLLIGNRGRRLAMSTLTRQHLDMFWELVDEILNAVLFVLIGLEVLVLTLNWSFMAAGLMAVPVALLARLISIGLPVTILRRWQTFAPRAIRIMTWGGLRGGISVALALSIPEQCHRELILTMTYVVVVFSILVQGLTIKALVGTPENRTPAS